MSDLYINKYIWNKKIINNLYKSCSELFNMNNLQLYNPLYSLYFHIYNTKNSHKCIDLERRYYVKEILDLIDNNLLNGCANITGGGIVDNLERILPYNLYAKINLYNVNPLKIFHWLKSHRISDNEMLKTFNCGVGFCLVINPKNLSKVIKFFPKKYKPYIIGKICSGTKQIKLHGKINWG